MQDEGRRFLELIHDADMNYIVKKMEEQNTRIKKLPQNELGIILGQPSYWTGDIGGHRGT